MKGKYTVRRISENLQLDLLSKNRTRDFVYGRFIAFKILKNKELTLMEIADLFGIKHTTVIYGLQQFKRLSIYDDFKLLIAKTECFKSEGIVEPHYCLSCNTAKSSPFFAFFTIKY